MKQPAMIEGEARNQFELSKLEVVHRLRVENPRARFCPVCGILSDQFLDGGVGKKRKNAKCPNCGSLERHRLFWLHFVNVVWPALPVGKKTLLHVAPEPFLMRLLREHPEINYVSGDLMMPQAMMKLDLTDIRFWDNQFDVIICSHILEHIPDDRKAMNEMYRVTKPGGFLLVMVPTHGAITHEDPSVTSPEERKRQFGQEDHVRRYGRDIIERLTNAGFRSSEWPAPSDVSGGLADFILCGRRVVFECKKPG